MTYAFTPHQDLTETNHATWEGGFTNQELDTIIEIGQSMQEARGTVGTGKSSEPVDEIRRSDVGWIGEQDAPWVFDRFAWIARDLNARFFGFDLYGFCEKLQFTTYRGDDGDGGHYDWHLDRGGSGRSGMPPRKLSFVLMLSDPSEYEGGQLQIQTGPKLEILSPERGIVHVFPSWVLHRVTPVTAGIRHTAVLWASGQKFR